MIYLFVVIHLENAEMQLVFHSSRKVTADTRTEHLGFLIGSVKIKTKTKTKQDGLKNVTAEVSNSSKLKIRDISKVLGSFEAALPTTDNGRF